jgi:hypothetical protein
VATTVEDAPWVDDHTGGVNLSGNNALGFNLHAAFGENHTIEAAGNHYAVPFDLSLDFGALAQNNCLLRNDVSFDVSINAERAGYRKRALEGHALIDETCPLFAGPTLCCCTGPLPRHGNPPEMTPITLPTPADKSTKRCDAGVESGDGFKNVGGPVQARTDR